MCELEVLLKSSLFHFWNGVSNFGKGGDNHSELDLFGSANIETVFNISECLN